MPPVDWSVDDVTTNEVGSPLRPVNWIDDAAAVRVLVAVPTVRPAPPPPSYVPVTPKMLTSFLMFPAVRFWSESVFDALDE